METNDVLFYETQKFKQWWIWLVLVGFTLFLIVNLYYVLFIVEQFEGRNTDSACLFITFGVCMLLLLLFVSLRLETIIKKEGIYVRFFPFHIKYKFYSWNSISDAYVRTYSPMLEYGGWGIRLGLWGKGKAYNVSGNKGVQLIFQNRKKLLIGTQKEDEIESVLQEFRDNTR